MQFCYKSTLSVVVSLLLLVSCQQQPKIYLSCAESDKEHLTLHENLRLVYRGFEIGEGKLTNLNGTYEFTMEQEEVSFTPNTVFTLGYSDMLGSRVMQVSGEVVSGSRLSESDTFYYQIETYEEAIPEEWIESVEAFRNSLDTLIERKRKQMDKADTINQQ